MFRLIPVAIAVAVFLGSGTFAGADKSSAASTGDQARLIATIDAAKAERAHDAQQRAIDVPWLVTEQASVDGSTARAHDARAVAASLASKAAELRSVAYEISNMPGLSASQNHQSVAAMDAADSAENDAHISQFNAASADAAASHDRAALDQLTSQVAALDRRIETCDQIVKNNRASLHFANRRVSARR